MIEQEVKRELDPVSFPEEMMHFLLSFIFSHEHWGSRYSPSLNGHLHYPADIDRTLNVTGADKLLQYRADYNNRPSHTISFVTGIASTSGSLHGESVCLVF